MAPKRRKLRVNTPTEPNLVPKREKLRVGETTENSLNKSSLNTVVPYTRKVDGRGYLTKEGAGCPLHCNSTAARHQADTNNQQHHTAKIAKAAVLLSHTSTHILLHNSFNTLLLTTYRTLSRSGRMRKFTTECYRCLSVFTISEVAPEKPFLSVYQKNS